MPNNAHPVKHNEIAPSFVVNVTQEHITEAQRCNGHKCMLAQAIQDAYRGRAMYIRVDMKGMQFSDAQKRRRFVYFHSNKTLRELLNFDHGMEVKPFSFQMRDGQVRGMGWKATHPKGWKPKPNRSSRGKGASNRVPRALRQFGLCTYKPSAALAARHAA